MKRNKSLGGQKKKGNVKANLTGSILDCNSLVKQNGVVLFIIKNKKKRRKKEFRPKEERRSRRTER